MTKRRTDPIGFLVDFANEDLDKLGNDTWPRLYEEFDRLCRPTGPVPGPLDTAPTGGVVPLARHHGEREVKTCFRHPWEVKRLQERLKLILQRVAWTNQRSSLFINIINARSARERQRARSLMEMEKGIRKKFLTGAVEVSYSGTFDVTGDGRGGFALHVSGGSPEETFLLVVLFILTRSKKLPFGSCLRCQKLFERVRRQRFCSTRCTNLTNQRFKRAGLAKPRKKARRGK